MSSDYRRSLLNSTSSRRSFMAFTGGGALALATARSLPALAADGEYEEGKAIPGDYTFENGTYVSPTDDALYQYATGTDGYAYCSKYEGGEWSNWEQAGDQTVGWDPAPVTYDGKSQAYYTGKDGYIYELTWDSYDKAQWEDVSGGYTFEASPYASTYEDSLHLYGTSTDGYVYHKGYTKDGGWGEWAPLNAPEYPAKTDSKPYSVSWSDHENTFWVGADDKVYWNRYTYADGTWDEPKEVPAEYGFKCTPYAVGYAPEKKLYAYSATSEGAPTWNSFADGEGWSGWQAYETEWAANYQPNAYVYQESMHVAYVSDDYNAYYTQYGKDGWDSEWADLGGNYGYDCQQYAYNDNLYLTYTGEDGGIYYRQYAFDGGGTLEPTETPEY
jgi:hypothetical protein